MAKANKLDLDLVEYSNSEPRPTEYLKLNPLGRVPSFEGADGYILTECIAIAVYRMCEALLSPCPSFL